MVTPCIWSHANSAGRHTHAAKRGVGRGPWLMGCVHVTGGSGETCPHRHPDAALLDARMRSRLGACALPITPAGSTTATRRFGSLWARGLGVASAFTLTYMRSRK